MGNTRARNRAHSARHSFSSEEKRDLLSLGLFPEQVKRLELNALRSIAWRRNPPPPMADVRAKLDDFKKLLDRVARHYLRMSTAGTAASAEAISRLYMAQEELGFDPLKPDEIDKLHDSLETATNIVSLALVNLPKIQRRNAWPSSEFVRLIRKALELGHVQHYQCSGFGETPSEPEPMPPFLIRVTRTRKPRMKKNRVPPFGEIVHIVSEASGGWSSDDAIRKYQQQRRVERLNTNKRGK